MAPELAWSSGSKAGRLGGGPGSPHPARAEVLHYDVGPGGEIVQDFAPLIRLQVEGEAALAAVPAQEAEAEGAKGVALQRFHLDDVRSVIGEEHRAERPRDVRRQVQPPDPGQRRRGRV